MSGAERSAGLSRGLLRGLATPPPGLWRTGIIVTRAMPPGFDQREYERILSAGRPRYGHALSGAAIYQVGERAQRAAQQDLDRLALDCHITHNIACNVGRTVALDFLAGNGTPSGITYFAVGTGAGTPAASDTQLSAEVFRKAVSTVTLSGNQVLFGTLFNTTDANDNYTEAGLFGNGATATANSGTLFAHAAYYYDKTVSITLTNDYFVFLN